jgi:hypothetical protein
MFSMNWRSFTLALIILLCGETFALGQSSNMHKLLDQRLTVQVKQATLLYVLDTLAIDHKIPVGLEMPSTEAYKDKLEINVEDGTLRDVLDSITQQQSAYQWEIRDGVINFMPTHDRYNFIAALLDKNIQQFSPDKGLDKFALRNEILQLTEIRELMSSNSVKIAMFTDSPNTQRMPVSNRADLRTSDATIRQILNKVVRESDYKIWVVDMTGRRKDELIISF